jgi:hypothetical protein
MSKLETRIERLEAEKIEPELLGVFIRFDQDSLEEQQRKFVEEHGREPDRSIVIGFTKPDKGEKYAPTG